MDNMKNKDGSKIHSVLIHKEKNNVIGCVNRDFNAVRNFMKITNELIKTGNRPLIYRRNRVIPLLGISHLLHPCYYRNTRFMRTGIVPFSWEPL